MTKALLIVALLLATSQARAAARTVDVYSWSDYIAPGTIPAFEKRTGIEVTYDTYDSNDTLDAKLHAGDAGYDVVVPSMMPYLAEQVRAGIYLTLDRARLPNWHHLDPALLATMATADPGNRHAIPWMTGTDGIGVNVAKVRALMPDAPVGSLAMLFDPAVATKFKDCGISVLDSEEDMIPEALIYLHLDPRSQDPAVLVRALGVFQAVRPFIRKFDSSGYINDLANGDLCVAFGYSTDINQAGRRARDAGRGVGIAYHIPIEGSQRWIDTIAIPADAPHPDAAYAWLDFLMDPAVIADDADFLFLQSGNADAGPLMRAAIRQDPGIFPPEAVARTLYTPALRTPAIRRVVTRLWTRIKTGE